LHEALDREVKQLKPVLDWFSRTLMLIGPRSTAQLLELKMHHAEEFRRFCNRVIQQIGAGIDDLGTELLPLENAALFFIVATEGAKTEKLYLDEFRPAREAVIQVRVIPIRS
jgi:hypothetical protein